MILQTEAVKLSPFFFFLSYLIFLVFPCLYSYNIVDTFFANFFEIKETLLECYNISHNIVATCADDQANHI